MNRFFFNKTSPQKAKMNRFTVLESQNCLSTSSECELQAREVRPRGAVGPPLPAAGGRAHRGLLRRDVRRHVQALLEGERRLYLLR